VVQAIQLPVQSVLWVAYSYLSQSWFAGYPYGTISSAAYEFLPFIQIAEFSGIWASPSS
jgi:apolipoprotein N-acyltransferase